jgi:hypothetical protein
VHGAKFDRAMAPTVMENSAVPNSANYEISLSAWEARMSLWIETPTLRNKATGEVVASFRDTNWSLNSARWLSDDVVELRMRKYPGSHTPAEIMATLDCSERTARIDGSVMPISQVETALEGALSWPQPPAATASSGLGGWIRRLIKAVRDAS